MKAVSVTEAVRNFSDLVSRAHYQGESMLLIKGGRPMVIVAPARKARTGRELAALWPVGPHLSLKAAEAFESELVAAKSKLGPIESAWD